MMTRNAVISFGVLLALINGCGSDATLYLPWDVDVGGNIRAGSITVSSNGHFGGNLDVGGTVTAENVIAVNDVSAGDDVSAVGNVDFGGQVVHTPPPTQPPPPPPPPPPASVCGNWILEIGEQCDRANFGNQTCLDYDGFVGGVLICNANCTINFSQCLRPPPPPEPTLLMATLQSHNGSDHFHVGDDVKLDFTVSGGVPPYDNRCLFVDGTFATNEDSSAMTFSFKEREARLKLINSPGAGVVTCEVTDARGKTTSASFTIYVE